MPSFPAEEETGTPASSNEHLNQLRQQRETAMLSRAQLSRLCSSLAEKDPVRYVTVAVPTLRNLEVGIKLPRRSTAATLAAALDVPVDNLFSRFADANRNPAGKTASPEAGKRRGRPAKKPPLNPDVS